MDWLRWLLDTRAFALPQHTGAWSPVLVWCMVISNFSLGVVCTMIGALLLRFRFRKGEKPVFFRSSRLATVFALLVFGQAASRYLAAFSFVWPAIRLQVIVTALTALWGWAAFALMLSAVINDDLVLSTIDEMYGQLQGVVARLKNQEEGFLQIAGGIGDLAQRIAENRQWMEAHDIVCGPRGRDESHEP